ncbi:MAG: redox-sensitive bicupin YhaK (pirin superfamily) [Gammaproteobacteria bacterium]|jgi:redox-sensitive bicupin YhaK (pirin superfamily)
MSTFTVNRTVQKIVTGQPATDGAGVELVRVIGQPGMMELDPFLLLDAFRSDNPNDYIGGFPAHPHRGFETVTYLLNGRLRHKDNAGNEGLIEPGGIQWMTAGRGIIHSEMPEQQDGLLEGFQLWINLPASDKMTAPGYQEHSAAEIPHEERPGSLIRVITGKTMMGTKGPVSQPLTDPIFLDVSLEADSSFEEAIPESHSAFVYVIQGEVTIGDSKSNRIHRDQLAILVDGNQASLSSDSGARFLLVAGKPLKEPIVRAGPFVMNTHAEIKQAFNDYQSGQI